MDLSNNPSFIDGQDSLFEKNTYYDRHSIIFADFWRIFCGRQLKNYSLSKFRP